MARAQAQYLSLSSGDTVYDRWQNYYVNASVVWDGGTWQWLPFDADGFVEGQTGDEGGITVTLPATALVMREVDAAIRAAWLAELQVYEFDLFDGNDAPQSGQDLVASFIGEVVGASGGFESITLELGSGLAPVGAQVPPRTCTTRLVGVPCKLGG
jgi:hypothetical protein